VLERGMEEALTLAESMDARGHGRGARSRYRPQPWTVSSAAVVVTSFVAAGAYLSASLNGWADLHPGTASLSPQADPALILAIALLAVPGFLRRGVPR
jgi:hypothetical protein